MKKQKWNNKGKKIQFARVKVPFENELYDEALCYGSAISDDGSFIIERNKHTQKIINLFEIPISKIIKK